MIVKRKNKSLIVRGDWLMETKNRWEMLFNSRLQIQKTIFPNKFKNLKQARVLAIKCLNLKAKFTQIFITPTNKYLKIRQIILKIQLKFLKKKWANKILASEVIIIKVRTEMKNNIQWMWSKMPWKLDKQWMAIHGQWTLIRKILEQLQMLTEVTIKCINEEWRR